MGGFQGKTALVTGAGMGIGRATAIRLASQGACVVCADINQEAASETQALIANAGGKASAVMTDVSDAEQCRQMVASAIDAFGSLHLAVNNAGVSGAPYSTDDVPLEEWRRIMSINLDGVFFCMKYELPEIVASGGGAVVNVSSICGLVAFPTAGPYVAAKHGVVGLTRTAAIEFAEKGVRINAVNPGFIMTPMQTNDGISVGDERYTYLAAKHPMNRFGEPEEVAAGIGWLLSDEAGFMTGACVALDGGYTAQ